MSRFPIPEALQAFKLPALSDKEATQQYNALTSAGYVPLAPGNEARFFVRALGVEMAKTNLRGVLWQFTQKAGNGGLVRWVPHAVLTVYDATIALITALKKEPTGDTGAYSYEKAEHETRMRTKRIVLEEALRVLGIAPEEQRAVIVLISMGATANDVAAYLGSLV